MGERQANRAVSYDFQAETVSIDGAVFDATKLPEAQRKACLLRGLAAVLMTSGDMAKSYAGMVAGEKSPIRVVKDRKSEPLANNWREAASIVHAEAVVKEDGVKPKPGQKLRDTDEFKAALEKARQVAAGFTLAQLSQAKRDPAVLAEFRKLEGLKASPLASLFAGSENAAPAEAAAAA